MDFGIYTIDINTVAVFFSQSTFEIIMQIIALGGWVIISWLLFFAGINLLADYKGIKYTSKWKWVLLAIDIPALNVQTPKAVEQLFTHLAGAFNSPNLAEKFYYGFKQQWFSFEIISIEGYIQFLVRTEENFRDLVEAAVYAQYPEAEIVEVEDYVNAIPSKFPNDTYDVWAADFTLKENSAFPIRTYRDFEHNISKDTVLKDPMGTFLESFSRIGPGEQMWFQIIIEPTSNSWKEEAMEKINEMVGTAKKSYGGSKIVNFVVNTPMKLLEEIGDQVLGREASAPSHDEADSGPPNQIQYLTPGKKIIVEAMEAKIAKLGFKTKLRGIYVARKEVFRPSRGVNALVGAITQFNVPSSNSLVPSLKANASYFFKKSRTAHLKRLLMEAYKKRKIKTGGNPFILNIEELATIWHFPMSHVKTPLIQKSVSKHIEPPAGLPMEGILPISEPLETKEETKEEGKNGYEVDTGSIEYPKDMKFG